MCPPLHRFFAVAGLLLALAGSPAHALDMLVGEITVQNLGDVDADVLDWDSGLTSTTAAAIGVSLYTYVDLDLAGAFGNDSATTNASVMVVLDGLVPTSILVWDVVGAARADHFQVEDYPTLRTALDNMTSAEDLGDTGSGFGSADFSGSHPFDRSLGAFGTDTIRMNAAIIPKPQPALLTGLGLVGLVLYGRRRNPPGRER